MTVLQELAALYDRRAEEASWPKPGFSKVSMSIRVVLDSNGTVLQIGRLGSPKQNGKAFDPQIHTAPAPPSDRRGKKIVPGRFWDPMPYALGVGGKTGAWSVEGDNATAKFEKFRREHMELLEGCDDPDLVAFRRFCETWEPNQFFDLPDAEALDGPNVAFEGPSGAFVHDLPAAHRLLAPFSVGDTVCLVTGERAAVARLHIPIKVPFHDKQPPLISFNEDAFESHGKSQGDNAPVSEAAAFAYGTALNALLARDSGNNIRIGGDTVAFWADQPKAEWTFEAFLNGTDDAATEQELSARLEAVWAGKARPPQDMPPDTRFFVLGLAPNAARLSVRYWLPSRLNAFIGAIETFWSQCAIAPNPFQKGGVPTPPRPCVLLYDLAALRDEKNIPPKLGGELMQAILTRAPFPATMLAAVLARIRAEGDPDRFTDGRRAALIRAVLVRNHEMEVPMALDETADDPAYLLGRLFAAYAYAERSYQDRGASLRSKYMGAASATPARVFPQLMRGYEHNLASLRKAGGQKAGAGVKADRAVAAIVEGLPGGGELPAALPMEDQGKFFVGFYHQISAFYAKAEDAADALIEDEGEDT